jgi:hypothetical protein
MRLENFVVLGLVMEESVTAAAWMRVREDKWKP